MALIKKQPQDMEKLIKEARISRATFYRKIPILKKAHILKEVKGGFALWTYDELESQIEEVILYFLKSQMSFMDAEDIAVEVGKPWEKIENQVYAVMKKYGLKMCMDGSRKFIFNPQGAVIKVGFDRKKNSP